jgi:carbamoyltransferase
MLLVSPIRERYRRSSEGDGNAATEKGLARLKRIRSEIPAVTHVDYSARIQTVDPLRHGRFHRLLQTFERRTGCPILINTSFNVRGEPIVCTAKDAYDCFMATNIDALVLEKYLLLKEQQSDKKDHRIESYLDRFELD